MTNPIKPDLESLTTHARIHDGLDLEAAQKSLESYLRTGKIGDAISTMGFLIDEVCRLRATPASLELIQECQRLREAAKPLTWTREKPTEPGWYWCCTPGIADSEEIIQLAKDESGDLFQTAEYIDEITSISEFNENCEWAGPIPPPQPEGTK